MASKFVCAVCGKKMVWTPARGWHHEDDNDNNHVPIPRRVGCEKEDE